MKTVDQSLIAAGIFLVVGAIAPADAFACGDPKAAAIFIASVLVLHIASIAAALLFLAKSRRWPIVLGTIAAATLVAIAWCIGFLQLDSIAAAALLATARRIGFLQFANNPSIAYEVTFWIWATVPFLALALSSYLYRHFRGDRLEVSTVQPNQPFNADGPQSARGSTKR